MEGGAAEQSKLVGGRYALESLLGTGGMGEVWRARHVALNTLVAIKFLHGASAQRLSTRKRFVTEAQVTAQLKTRHAVQVFDFGVTDEGQPYLVMELLEGETLGHRITRQTRLPIATTARFLEQAARALERAHAVGIVHRDFKPDNIVISLDEEGKEHVKVLDFGIAKLLNELEADSVEDERDASADAPPNAKAFATFTKTGTILGTPLYMSPEQVRNSADLDLRADIWAFGVVAYQCLTGVPPFEGKNLIQLFERITTGIHPRAKQINPELPAAFDAWFDVACSPDATKRFASAKAAATHLAIALEVREASTGGGVPTDVSSARDLRDSHSGERPAGTDPSAAHAPTLEAMSMRGIVSSQRPTPGEKAIPDRLQRVPASKPPPAIESDAATSKTAESHHASVTDSAERPPSKTAKRRAVIVAIGVAAALAAIATWRVNVAREVTTTVPQQPTASAATTTTASVNASATPTASVTPSATASSVPSASASDSIATSPPPKAPTPGYGRPIAQSAPPATTTAAPPATATAAPPETTAAPPPKPPAPTSSPASPFKLPPLGI